MSNYGLGEKKRLKSLVFVPIDTVIDVYLIIIIKENLSFYVKFGIFKGK